MLDFNNTYENMYMNKNLILQQMYEGTLDVESIPSNWDSLELSKYETELLNCYLIESLYNAGQYKEAEQILLKIFTQLEGNIPSDHMYMVSWLLVLRVQLMHAQPDKYTGHAILAGCAQFEDMLPVIEESHRLLHFKVFVNFIKADALKKLSMFDEAFSCYSNIIQTAILVDNIQWIKMSLPDYLFLGIRKIKLSMLGGRSNKKELKTNLQEVMNQRKHIERVAKVNLSTASEFEIYFNYIRFLNGSSEAYLLKNVRDSETAKCILDELISLEPTVKDKELIKIFSLV